MKPTCFVLAISFVVLSSAAATADDIDTAQKCVNFWAPFEGTWQSSTDGEKSVWLSEKSASGLCYVSYSKIGDKVVSNGIHGYDPETKCWKVVGFRVPSDSQSWIHRTSWIHVDMETLDHVQAGVTGVVEARQIRADGRIVEERGKLVVDKISKGKIAYRIIDRTEGGEEAADLNVVMERE